MIAWTEATDDEIATLAKHGNTSAIRERARREMVKRAKAQMWLANVKRAYEARKANQAK